MPFVNTFKLSFKFYLALIVIVALVLSEVKISQCVPLTKEHHMANEVSHESKTAEQENNHLFDEINICIMACVKCSGEDLDDNKDIENSLSLSCSNECLMTPDPRNMVVSFLASDLYDKAFAKCFLNNVENPSLLNF